jgi:hypothetical protein
MPKFKPVRQTPQQIVATANKIQAAAEELRAASGMVEHAGFESLDVGSFDQLTKALIFLDSYRAAVSKALLHAQAERGDFHAPVNPPKKRIRPADTNGAK